MLNIKKFLPYIYPKNYTNLLKQWLLNNPWVKIEDEVKFPLETKVLGTSVYIKERTIINGPMTIKGSDRVLIGKYCSIAENLFIISSNHIINRADIQGEFTIPSDQSKGPVYIGNNVWCGDNVTILSGVTIGDGAAIGAGSVVTRDIPPFGIAVGAPARVVKYRFSKTVINKLLMLSWWHWNKKTVEKNVNFFRAIINDGNIDSLIKNINYEFEEEITLLNFKSKKISKWLLDGWGIKEKDTIWAEKKQAEIVLKIKNPKKFVAIIVNAYSYYLPQKVTVFINRKKVGRIKIQNYWGQYKLNIKNLKNGINIVRFDFERGFVPANLNIKEKDKRSLYCNFKSIQLI
ncbi:MAG: CatB-related O-acetyltransferase [Patescibacteria group bacterium]|jgi:acetyltransferase-like isoleucine patch superfamily enzyme